jgi:hypothetical protein
MRHRWPSKQCVWLGPGRYLCGRRRGNANSNANRHRDTYSNRDSDSDGHRHRYPNGNSNTDGDNYTHSYAQRYCSPSPDTTSSAPNTSASPDALEFERKLDSDRVVAFCAG